MILQHDEPPVETSKLAIVAETEADRYDTATLVSCFECGETNLIGDKIDAVVDGVLKANTFAKQAEVKAWELEITPCEHTLCLQQESARPLQQGLSFGAVWTLLMDHRSRALLCLRAQAKSMALLAMWQSRMWPQSNRWSKGQ